MVERLFTYGETVCHGTRHGMFMHYNDAALRFATVWFDNSEYLTIPSSHLSRPLPNAWRELKNVASELFDKIKENLLHEGD